MAMRLSSDDLPMFFDDSHAALAVRLRAAAAALEEAERVECDDATIVDQLARAGLFELVAPAAGARMDARSLCLAREALGYVSARGDSILAVQGLGVQPILLAGS